MIVCEKILLKHHLRCSFRKESNRNGTKIIITKKTVTGSTMMKMKITILPANRMVIISTVYNTCKLLDTVNDHVVSIQ